MTKAAIRYTTAEPDYDYSYTTHMGIVGFDRNDRPVRKVHVEAGRVEHQCGRYLSGNRFAIDHIEYAKQIEHGFIRPAPSIEVNGLLILDLRLKLATARENLIEERKAIAEDSTSKNAFIQGANYGRDATLQAAAQTLDALDALLTEAGA